MKQESWTNKNTSHTGQQNSKLFNDDWKLKSQMGIYLFAVEEAERACLAGRWAFLCLNSSPWVKPVFSSGSMSSSRFNDPTLSDKPFTMLLSEE